MRVFLSFFLCPLTVYFSHLQPSKAQKIKFTLELNNERYVGTMTPKWYDQIQIEQLHAHQLTGAKGKMQGARFPTMDFEITKNKTGTKDSLMLKTSNGWYPIERLKWSDNQLKLTFDWGFQDPARAIELKVLQKANELLATEENWNPNDDRLCDDDFSNNQWSLYCLLKKAYLLETGDFNHRAAALNILRGEISRLNPQRKYKHQLMEFNNVQSFQNIKDLIALSIQKIRKEIK